MRRRERSPHFLCSCCVPGLVQAPKCLVPSSDPAGQAWDSVSQWRDLWEGWVELESSPGAACLLEPRFMLPPWSGGRSALRGQLAGLGARTDHLLPEHGGLLCGPQSCLTRVRSRATQQPPDGRRLPGAGPGLKQAGGSGGRMESQPLGRPLAQGQGVAEEFGIFSCLRFASGGEPSGGTCPFCLPHVSLSGLEQLPTPSPGTEG